MASSAPFEAPPEFDAGVHHRAKTGYVLLATEQTVQDDVVRLTPAGVGVHFTRVPIPDSITVDTLAGTGAALGDAAALLLPDGSLDTVAYACTSGSIVLGEERVFAEFARGAPGARPTSIITGVLAALEALEARRIVVATPYLDEINDLEAEYMSARGFEVLALAGMNIERDSDMVRVTPDYIARYALALDRPDADAIFVSCGALRSLDVIERMEQAAGKPVVVSNQALVWHSLRLAGIDDPLPGYGALLARH